LQEERKEESLLLLVVWWGGVGVKSFPLPACMLRGWSAKLVFATPLLKKLRMEY
jgi:hypothetical protein